uniref:G_PROTEIN_RECEP_F1_2 domain-containing protein n=1 Tax=Macrostomum lignano TaxID=282301 RepID=A0A1I8J736_9PLAT
AYATLIANGTLGSCFLLIANAVLAGRLCAIARSRRARWRLPEESGRQLQQWRAEFPSSSNPMESFDHPSNAPAAREGTSKTEIVGAPTPNGGQQQHQKQKPRQKRQKESTTAVRTGITLMAASAAHLAGSLPRAITYLIAGVIHYGNLASKSELTAAQLRLVFELGALFDYLFYLNCSLNWLIYCGNVPDLRPW